MTKRQKHALETRQKIYETARSLIEGKGFVLVSVEDITNACGFAKTQLPALLEPYRADLH